MSFRFLSSLLTLTLMTLFVAALSPAAKAQAQERNRIVERVKLPREPVKISVVKNKKNRLKPGEKFLDDDDWLDGFAVTVVNTSGKTITSLKIDLTFVRPRNHATSDDPPLGYPLQFNPSPFSSEHALRDRARVVRPGESIDLVLRDDEYSGIKRFLKQLNYPDGVHRVEVMIHTVGFEDGTAWGAGTTFHPDPAKPDKLVSEPEPLDRAAQTQRRFPSGPNAFAASPPSNIIAR